MEWIAGGWLVGWSIGWLVGTSRLGWCWFTNPRGCCPILPSSKQNPLRQRTPAATRSAYYVVFLFELYITNTYILPQTVKRIQGIYVHVCTSCIYLFVLGTRALHPHRCAVQLHETCILFVGAVPAMRSSARRHQERTDMYGTSGAHTRDLLSL